MSYKKIVATLAPQFNRVEHLFENLDLDNVMACIEPQGTTAWSVTFYELVHCDCRDASGGMRRIDPTALVGQIWLTVKSAKISADEVLTRGLFHVKGLPLRRHLFTFDVMEKDFRSYLRLRDVKTVTGFDLLSLP